MILTARDAKNAGMCLSGQKRFCEAHDIDFRRFLQHGVDVSELEHIDDANLTKAIELAKQREQRDG